MFPWKMLFRFFSATVLLTTGGFAAGQDLPIPFDSAPIEVVAPAPVADPVDTTTTTVPVDESTTTTTAPGTPEVEPVPVPSPIDPMVVDPEPTPTTTAPAKSPVGVAAPADTPPAAPVDGDAPAVCAAAKRKACGPAEPAAPTAAPAADNSHEARVERCQDWWNSLAQAFDQNGRPEWATRARAIADRCDAMITRWEEAQKRWEEHRKAKGDHNDDGRPDNGRAFRRDGRDDRHKPEKAEVGDTAGHREGRH